ncbi:MAG: CDF-like metal transporter [Piptocephalis tieghemiana]|nr:MAG: CDF-like metal transporter [Piptocephalis tieghemiana]
MAWTGSFPGNTESLPLYEGAKTSAFHGPLSSFSSGTLVDRMIAWLTSVLGSKDSRNIFYFMCLNLSFMLVQVVYGYWTNSLGLITDAVHMFFDCLALALGLIAAVMAKWPPSSHFPLGYERVGPLAGFANAVSLVIISLSLLVEAVERLINPPEIETFQLLIVASLGLAVNLVGIFVFHHGQAHGHEEHHHHHGHGHHHHHHSHEHNANMKGVFLHILADTLGSVGVIVSTICIDLTGWHGWDPLASIFISLLIITSVIPLLRQTAAILLLQPDSESIRLADHLTLQVQGMPEVLECLPIRLWPLHEGALMGQVRVVLTPASQHDALHVMRTIETLCTQAVPSLVDLHVYTQPTSSSSSSVVPTLSDLSKSTGAQWVDQQQHHYRSVRRADLPIPEFHPPPTDHPPHHHPSHSH